MSLRKPYKGAYPRSLRDTTMETTNWLLVAILVVLIILAVLIGVRW